MSGPQKVVYRFLVGPMTDREIEMPRGIERVELGGNGVAALWVYELAGNEGGITLLAKRQSSRAIRRLIFQYIGKKAKHPAMLSQSWRRYPKTGTTDRTGQGARRRAEKAAANG